MSSVDPSYKVFIRLPISRGDFVDPPFVEWDASKDKQLWKIVTDASTNSDHDWNKLASKFGVPLAFLLQQVAWLYEQHIQQVQAQIRKVRVAKGAAVTGSKSELDDDVARTGSDATAPRASSTATHRRDISNATATVSSVVHTGVERIVQGSPITVNTPTTTAIPLLSRLPSVNTTLPSLNAKQISPRHSHFTLSGRAASPETQTSFNAAINPQPRFLHPKIPALVESASSDSSTGSELPILSPIIRRSVRHAQEIERSKNSTDDDDEPAFIPFPPIKTQSREQTIPTSSKDDVGNNKNRMPIFNSHSLLSKRTIASTSRQSSASNTRPSSHEMQNRDVTSSPKRFSEIDGRIFVTKGKTMEGNEGTPSMGSSFSDLDDASITQSALEEALASNMQAGGMASRMSTISQAIRSKYL